MTTSDMVRELCEKQSIKIAELCRKIGQSPQNFNKKLNRATLCSEEMIAIADALGVTYEQTFVLKNGEKIQIGNQRQTYKK
ncbi:MAG: helix-turn-helix domain-containing protein [Lachnotalea sp.]